MSARFGVSDAIGFSWARFKEQPGKLIGMFFIAGLACLVPYIIAVVLLNNDMGLLGALFMLATIVICLFVGMGMVVISLRVADRKPWDFGDLFSHTSTALSYIGASILVGLITIGGMFLFVLPGMYWGVRFSQYAYFVIEKKQGVMDALRSSWALTQGSFWDLFSAEMGFGMLVYVSMIPLGLGLFVTIPMSVVFRAYIFRQMEKNPSIPVT